MSKAGLRRATFLCKVYSLDFATQNRSPLRGENQISDPPQGGSSWGSGGLRPAAPPGFQPAPRALLGCGACRPQTPWAAPPVRPSAHGPLLRSISHGVGGSAWRWAALLSTGRRDPLFSPLQREIFNREASEARQAGGGLPVGKWGGRCGVVGSFAVHKSTATPHLSIGQIGHGSGASLIARRRRSALCRQ